MKQIIKVGSRESRLAVIQSQLVIDAIKMSYPHLEVELVTMKTTGDIILDRTLDKIGGKGLFVKELDLALMEGRVDICVHSYKDMPVDDNPQLPVVAVGERGNPFDVLVLPDGVREIDQSQPAGCSSARRRLQLGRLYPQWAVKPVRGNVITRLEKLDKGEYGGLILAAAGLERLGLGARSSYRFTLEEMIPSACQGFLAVQGRVGEDFSYLSSFNNRESQLVSTAERSFIRRLDGGCSSPVAAYARIDGTRLLLTGMYVNKNGDTFADELEGDVTGGEALGITLAERLIERGR